jgi:hypothetical protein
MGFDTAVYTDVSRDEAVDSVDGFNFQAVSAGIDGADLRHIRELLLHQISNRWPADRDDREHPATAAYLQHEGRFYFSRGISTGTTKNGRRGNQLTQAVVTRDEADLIPYRPAQIHAATQWRLEKATGKQSEQWFAPLEIHPDFEAEALLEWAVTDPQVVALLPTYLSMLEQATEPQARKVVIVHDDLDLVLRWFALGTLLLDDDVARRLEYRAFAIDPFQTRAQLVGVSPQLQQGPISGAHIVDLVAGTTSAFPVTASAQKVVEWVGRLDAFDALDVIGIARRWMPVIGVQTGAAGAEMVTGVRIAAVGREEWDLGIAVIEGLAENGLRDDLELYLDELAGSVAGYRLADQRDFERSARSARFAAGTGITGLAEAILAPALESLTENPRFAAAWAGELNAEQSWAWPTLENPARIGELLGDIIQAAPDDALGHLLSLAEGRARDLPADLLGPTVHRAAALVLRDPHRYTVQMPFWYGQAGVRAALRVGILERLAQAAPLRATTLRDLSDGVWDFLDPSEGERTPEAATFKPWLTAAAMSRIPIDERAERISTTSGLRPGTWELALAGSALPADLEVIVAWVARMGAHPTLTNHLRLRVEPMLNEDPKHAKAKTLERWIPLMDALIKEHPDDGEYRRWQEDLLNLLDNIPSLSDRMKAVGKVMGMGKGD